MRAARSACNCTASRRAWCRTHSAPRRPACWWRRPCGQPAARRRNGQVLLVPRDTTPETLAGWLRAETGIPDPLIRYADGGRQVVRWEVVAPAPEAPPCAFRDDGVYLLTGGLGGVGRLVATAILTQTRHAVVIVAGRAPLTPDTQR